MTTMTATTTQVYQVFIRATPEQIWDAITKPEFTAKYFHGARIETTRRAGTPLRMSGPTARAVGRRARSIESDPPRRLVHGWRSLYDPELRPRSASRVTWEIEPRRTAAVPAHGRPRPARGRAEDGGERLRRGLDDVLSGLKTLLETGRPMHG